jgi:cyclophilin family peptidyl-prolyl cis-trans isomerase
MKKHFVFILLILINTSIIRAQAITDTAFVYEAAPDTFRVLFETTKGNVTVESYRNWAPLAADRFHFMVESNYYDSIVVFRVVKGFVAQFGLCNDSAKNAFYRAHPIVDEPVKVSNKKGTLVFARAGKDSRTNQLFINLNDNTFLNEMNYGGTVGFPPFAKVIDGMDVVMKFYNGYGEAPSQAQFEIADKGITFTRQNFPELDIILNARLIR